MLITITENSKGQISGFIEAAEGDTPNISLWCADIRIRSLTLSTGEMSGRLDFRFKAAPSLLALLPAGYPMAIQPEDGNASEVSSRVDPDTPGTAQDAGAELRRLFGCGYVVDKWGSLKLPFSANKERVENYAAAMRWATCYFQPRFEMALFPHYGSLLGLTRSGTFLPHDDDVDLSFFISAPSIEDVVERFYQVVYDLKEDGNQISLSETGQFHLRPDDTYPWVDVFLSWSTSVCDFHTYFGVSGILSESLRFEDSILEGVPVRVPVQRQEILALTYGPNWRVPDPNFTFRPAPEVSKTMKALVSAGQNRLATFMKEEI